MNLQFGSVSICFVYDCHPNKSLFRFFIDSFVWEFSLQWLKITRKLVGLVWFVGTKFFIFLFFGKWFLLS